MTTEFTTAFDPWIPLVVWGLLVLYAMRNAYFFIGAMAFFSLFHAALGGPVWTRVTDLLFFAAGITAEVTFLMMKRMRRR